MDKTLFSLLLIVSAITFLILCLFIYNSSYQANTNYFLWILVSLQSLLFLGAVSGAFMSNKWLAIYMFIAQYIVGVIVLLMSEKYQVITIAKQEMPQSSDYSFDITNNWKYIIMHVGNVIMLLLGIFSALPIGEAEAAA